MKPQTRRWLDKDYYQEDIVNTLKDRFDKYQITGYDTQDYIEVDLLRTLDDELMLKFISKPDFYIHNAWRAINDAKPPDVETVFMFRPINVPNRKKLRDIKPSDVNKLVAVECCIRSVKQAHDKVEEAVYTCSRCGTEIVMRQGLQEEIKPNLCLNENCGRSAGQATFDLDTDKSTFIIAEDIYLEEARDIMTSESYKMYGVLTDDLCQRLRPGLNVVVNGIVRPLKKQTTLDKNRYDLFLEILSVEYDAIIMEDERISVEEEAEIRELGKRDDIINVLLQRIAPDIFCMDEIKLGLLLSLAGGVKKTYEDQSKRGNIHVLMVGDPGTGKSKLLRSLHKLAPLSIMASGKGASGVGLTAGAIHDKVSGDWSWNAGVLVLADRGFALIDEFEKMDDNDRNTIHEPMEQETVSFNKAGMNLTLQSRTTVIAAANPKKGRFNIGESISEQIELDPALLSRFDLIFPVLDEINRDNDKALATSILDSHRKLALFQKGDGDARNALASSLSYLIFRKYINYARMKVFPTMTSKAMSRLRDVYVETRSEQGKDEVSSGVKRRVSITARQLEALIRLTEASARLRLKDEADDADADVAISVFNFMLDKICRDKDGALDIDRILSGRDRGRESRVEKILQAFRDLRATDEAYKSDGVPGSVVAKYAVERWVKVFGSEAEVLADIKKIWDSGELYTGRKVGCYFVA